jgi:hypothetical protein
MFSPMKMMKNIAILGKTQPFSDNRSAKLSLARKGDTIKAMTYRKAGANLPRDGIRYQFCVKICILK